MDKNIKAIELKNITKKFSGVTAIDNVSLEINKNEIHALVGENGAGKSTLMNVLCGIFNCSSYDGEVIINGEKVRLLCPQDAFNCDVAMVHQEIALIPQLTVAENVFLGNLITKNGMVDLKEMRRKAEAGLKSLSLDVDVNLKVGQLGIGQQQLIEIAKAVLRGGKIIILDEPTAPLTKLETDLLFDLLQKLKEKGITIIYISHRLEEIFKISDRVTVLRDGKKINTFITKDIDEHTLVENMIGREMVEFYPDKASVEPGEVVLKICEYSVPHPEFSNKNIVDDVSMEFRAGEIVGISGLLGAGRTELMSAITGSYETKGDGDVYISGKKVSIKNPKDAIDLGIGFLTEDRKGNGLIIKGAIDRNISLASLDNISSFGVIDSNREEKLVNEATKNISIKCSGFKQEVRYLSGGNQQKVVFSKWLAIKPKVLILDEPTRGVDVGARYEIYSIIRALANEGVAVVMISSDMQEIIGMSDRVYIMYEGKLTGELKADELAEKVIMSYATGIKTKLIDGEIK